MGLWKTTDLSSDCTVSGWLTNSTGLLLCTRSLSCNKFLSVIWRVSLRTAAQGILAHFQGGPSKVEGVRKDLLDKGGPDECGCLRTKIISTFLTSQAPNASFRSQVRDDIRYFVAQRR